MWGMAPYCSAMEGKLLAGMELCICMLTRASSDACKLHAIMHLSLAVQLLHLERGFAEYCGHVAPSRFAIQQSLPAVQKQSCALAC